ncbi:MAG: acyltransferase [Gammaproteobacteria bacterium]|nr:acyltransferase [Gammaproteobacteria bacterium]MCP5424027.1 acyltransferase [Gammaproteobacteria bacterium]MCP5459539.1 acyltransferase [Gammaproteobacteria bacterium]
MQYRKEIDGLRAIAVLAVIFFHADLFRMTGGFIGVDVFFVISGYLITTILIEEIERNRFSILNFYERRARRIFPVLGVVLLVTTLAAFVLMPAYLLRSYSKSLVSVSVFLSNVFFYLTSGYYSTASAEKPLLHTWSLAVEEQYYVFFPILLSMLWFIGRKCFAIFLLILSVASFLFSQYLLFKQAGDANYYLIFSRVWEPLAGSLIAVTGICRLSVGKDIKNILGYVGATLIIGSIVFLDRSTPAPSLFTLFPVIGACLVIMFCDNTTAIGKVLANRFLVGMGLISYSLYLWHQPIFAFIRMKTIGEPSDKAFIGAIALIFVLSVLSYQYVERPFRDRKIVTRTGILKFSVITILLSFSVGLSGYVFEGFNNRLAAANYLGAAQFSPKTNECHTLGENYLKPKDACRYFGKNVTWASFGDSHAVEPAYALAKMLEQNGEGVLQLSFSGCPPALLFEIESGCSKWINESLDYLENARSIKNVLLGFRYRKSLYEYLGDRYWDSLHEIIVRLLASGKNVYLLYPTPELPVDMRKAAMPLTIFGGKTMLDLEKSIPSRDYFEKNRYILSKLDTLPYGKNLHAIEPFQIFCNRDYCPAVIDGTPLYLDDNHLSVEGSKLLLEGSVVGKVIGQKKALSGLPEKPALVSRALESDSR